MTNPIFTRTWGRHHGGRRPSSDDNLHSPTVIPPLALDKPSIMKRYHRRRTCSHASPRRSPTMVTLHDTRFVECRWWNDGWTVKTVVTRRSSAATIPAPGHLLRQTARLLFLSGSSCINRQSDTINSQDKFPLCQPRLRPSIPRCCKFGPYRILRPVVFSRARCVPSGGSLGPFAGGVVCLATLCMPARSHWGFAGGGLDRGTHLRCPQCKHQPWSCRACFHDRALT